MNSAMNPSLSQVTLIAPHTHEGKTYASGESIAVDAATAQWLQQHGIARGASESAVTNPPPVSKLVKDSK